MPPALTQPARKLCPGELTALIRDALGQRDLLLRAGDSFGTPQFLVDQARIDEQARRFLAAFASPQQPSRAHYALKANPTVPVVRAVRDTGLCADASSGLELQLALRCGFPHVVLSGPAKTDSELLLALDHADRVTVHLDSFLELARLERLAGDRRRKVRAGVRVNLDAHGGWTKFGIPASELGAFVAALQPLRWVQVEGVQFHLSWNRCADGYVDTLRALGPLLERHAPPRGWRFVDIGGGYYPEDDEAAYPWAEGAAGPAPGPPPDWDLRYLVHNVQPIEEMAADILAAFRQHVTSRVGALDLWLEPGRYIVNRAVHLLLRVADVKSDHIAITDGGTNLLGWERMEAEHCPLINLTHPAESQRACHVYGSLCTPHDLWGYTYYGTRLEVGDLLLLPAQGSYVQTLAQRFIKPLCQTILWGSDGSLTRAEEAESFSDRYPQLADA